jgi:hypothetical protein
MNPLTVTDMVFELKMKPATINRQLNKLGIKPIPNTTLYDPSAMEAIREAVGNKQPDKK